MGAGHADTSVHKNSLEQLLAEFSKEAIQLHENYMVQAVQHTIARELSGAGAGDAYPKIPLGVRVSARVGKDGPEIYRSEYRLLDEDKKPDGEPDGGETK